MDLPAAQPQPLENIWPLFLDCARTLGGFAQLEEVIESKAFAEIEDTAFAKRVLELLGLGESREAIHEAIDLFCSIVPTRPLQ